VSGVLKHAAAVCHNRAIPYAVEFSLYGKLSELERLAAEIDRFRAENSLSEDAGFQLNLVLEELFVNAVRHGGCEGSDAARVSLHLEENGVHVRFLDRGRPFDLTRAPAADTASPLQDRQPGGLGIHLVRQMMRGLTYRRLGEWNQLDMLYPNSESL
jgi:anti-sigma regulatory factor (Ser/Thr protein kinase)